MDAFFNIKQSRCQPSIFGQPDKWFPVRVLWDALRHQMFCPFTCIENLFLSSLNTLEDGDVGKM